MKKQKISNRLISLSLIGLILLAGCGSATMIQSTPVGASVFLNEERVGITPYTHRDTKIVGSSTVLRLEKEGYDSFSTTITRNEEVDVGAVIGGIFFLFPFLWTMKYKPVRNYEMVPTN